VTRDTHHLNAAKALGITITQSFIVRADEMNV
jgi:hypothetical protein